MLHFHRSSILIDRDLIDKELLWYGEDNYKNFKLNKRLLNSKYIEKEITYKFNQNGYRSKNFDEVDNDFVLIFGCSHTEGVGLHNEDIWCNQLCDRIGIDRINLGKSGTGADIQYINTMQYIKNNYPKPKLVIYQWPQSFRRSFAYELEDGVVLQHVNVRGKAEKLDTEWFFHRYCAKSSQEQYIDNYTAFTISNMLWEKENVPVFSWNWREDFNLQHPNNRSIDTIDTGRARDMKHDGPDIHNQVVNLIYKDIDKLL